MDYKVMRAEIRDLTAKNDRLTNRLAIQMQDAILARGAVVAIDRLTSESLGLLVQSVQPKITELIKKGLRE